MMSKITVEGNVTYSLMEKLQQLADSKSGGPMPPFLSSDNWGIELSEMAKEALEIINAYFSMRHEINNADVREFE